jgi:hypothetical protein
MKNATIEIRVKRQILARRHWRMSLSPPRQVKTVLSRLAVLQLREGTRASWREGADGLHARIPLPLEKERAFRRTAVLLTI